MPGAQPTARQVHVNAPLTQISIAYIQEQEHFIADQVFPAIPVAKQSDRYFKYPREFWFRSEARERGPGAESAGSGFEIDNTPTYYCPVIAVHKDVADQVRANADAPIEMDRDATIWVTQQLLIKREKVWGESYFTDDVWSTELDGDTADFVQWNEANSDPINDITQAGITMTSLTGRRPNVLVLAPDVYNMIRNHEEVVDRIKYTERGIVTADIIAGLFDVERVLIPWGVENLAPEGQDGDFEFIFANKALLVYANPTPSIMQPSGGYMFNWQGLLGAGQQGTRIRSFRIEERASDRIEGEMAFDAKLVADDLGVFFENCLSTT